MNRLFFATFLALSLVLGACGDTGNPTSTVQNTDTLTTVSPVVTTSPDDIFTEEPTEQTTETVPTDTRWPTATEPVSATAAVDVGTPDPTLDVDEPTMTETETMTDTAAADNWRASSVLDYDVWNYNDEQIGTVEDLLIDIDGQDERVAYVIIEVGGFLGIGGKQVAVPFDQVKFGGSEGTPDSTGMDDPNRVLFLDVTRETLDTAPEFNRDELPDLGQPGAGYDAGWNEYWAGQSMTDTQITAPLTPTNQTDLGTTDTLTATQLQGPVLATQLIDLDVRTQAYEDFAEVEDVVLDPNTGDALYLVVELNGMDELDGRWMLVPFNALSSNATADGLVVTASDDLLRNAPTYDADQLPDTNTTDWDMDVRNYWNVD